VGRYFFNIVNDQPDLIGAEFGSLKEAKCAAVKLAGTMICDTSESFWREAEWGMAVTDERGLTLFMLSFVGSNAPVIRWGSPRPACA
jgi:hypothetical protein